MLKSSKFIFSPHQSALHNPQWQERKTILEIFVNILKINNKEHHIHLSVQTLYAVLSWSTFCSDYSLKTSLVWRDKLCTSGFGDFLPLFSADPLKISWFGWGLSVASYFQVSLEMFVWVQVQSLAGPLKDIHRVVLSHSCIVFALCLGSLFHWKVNLQPSLRPRVLWNRFPLKRPLYSVPVSFPSTTTCLPVPAAEKKAHSMTLTPTCRLSGFLCSESCPSVSFFHLPTQSPSSVSSPDCSVWLDSQFWQGSWFFQSSSI